MFNEIVTIKKAIAKQLNLKTSGRGNLLKVLESIPDGNYVVDINLKKYIVNISLNCIAGIREQKMEYADIYVQGYEYEPTKHSISFDGKEIKILGTIPHQSKITIDRSNAEKLKGFIDCIAK